MEKQFWLDRWAEQRIGFHLADINPHLRRYWSSLGVPPGGRVLVPLCGKSLDMLWLRDLGYEVLGVEFSAIAIRDFARENALALETFVDGDFVCARTERVTLLQGDFFHLDSRWTDEVVAVYDRAALVALPGEMRRRYVAKLAQLLVPGTEMLLVSMNYPQDEMSGPPFSVSEDEIALLYEDAFDLELLETVDVLAANPRLAEKGISRMTEQIWRIWRR